MKKKRYLHLYQVSPVQMKQINFYIPKNSNRFGSSCELELVAIDLAADRRVGAHFAVLVENNCLRVGGTYVASAKVFHSITSSWMFLMSDIRLYV